MLRRLHGLAFLAYVLFGVFSALKGVEIHLLRVEYNMMHLLDATERVYVDKTEFFALLSLLFFAFVLALFLYSLRITQAAKRAMAFFGAFIALIMLVWSLLMKVSPTHISFDEVYPAWLAALMLLLICSLVLFRIREHQTDPDLLDQEV